MDKLSPTNASKAARAGNLRLVGALGITAGFFRLYTRSSCWSPALLLRCVAPPPPPPPGERSGFCDQKRETDDDGIVRFWGWAENEREQEMDMREMVDKVKNKQPLYGASSLEPYMQGVAARNSRYSQVFLHAIPWFNLTNHNQVSFFFLFLGKV
jgi:hypothetical protein